MDVTRRDFLKLIAFVLVATGIVSVTEEEAEAAFTTAQYQMMGGGIDETSANQYQIPGGPGIDETQTVIETPNFYRRRIN